MEMLCLTTSIEPSSLELMVTDGSAPEQGAIVCGLYISEVASGGVLSKPKKAAMIAATANAMM